MVSHYLASIDQHRPLTAEDEVVLAQRIEAGLAAQGRIDRGDHDSDGTLRSLQQAAYAGLEAKNRFVASNLRLVVSCARKHTGANGMEFLNAVQEGNLGLIRAVDKYDWRNGLRFSTHATWWIRHAITRALVDKPHVVRLPDQVHEVATVVAPTRARSRTITRIKSSSPPVGDIGSPYASDGPRGTAFAEVTDDAFREAFEQLPAEHQRLLTLRYGLDGEPPRSRERVGLALGVDHERLRHLEQNALSRMRHPSSGLHNHDNAP